MEMLYVHCTHTYIVHVCKHDYRYSIAKLTALFESLTMSIFLYGIKVWDCAFESKYIKFCKKVLYTPFRPGLHVRRKHKHKDVYMCNKHKHKVTYVSTEA